MTYIPEINQAQTAQALAKESTSKTSSKTLGQEDFLTLLVAQLQNQDPLNPSDPTEFTSQLAQYSELEQLFNLNSSMESLAKSQNNSERFAALSLMGKEVLVTGSKFSLNRYPTEIGYNVDGVASDITINIQNSSGTQVATLHATDLSKGNHFMTWNGLGKDGEKLPEGQYQLVLQAQSAGEETSVAVNPLVYSTVTGVDLDNSGAMLITEAGEYSISDIEGVYDRNSTQNSSEEENQPAAEDTISDLLADTVGDAADSFIEDQIGTE